MLFKNNSKKYWKRLSRRDYAIVIYSFTACKAHFGRRNDSNNPYGKYLHGCMLCKLDHENKFAKDIKTDCKPHSVGVKEKC